MEAKTKIIRQKDLDEAHRLEQILREIENIEVNRSKVPKINYTSKVIVGPRKISSFYEYNQEWLTKVKKKNEELKKQQELKEITE